MSVNPTPPPHGMDVPENLLVFPCSSSQQRCWIVEATSPGTTALNIALRWELRGPFTAALVEEAFQTVVDRQEAL
ncbi:MAG: hypothetical protein INR70_44475, partial [Parafilimonas terrae]|nr:hypothetical protein [Parafilimonas terrae]